VRDSGDGDSDDGDSDVEPSFKPVAHCTDGVAKRSGRHVKRWQQTGGE
jgi:hypothetical protein